MRRKCWSSMRYLPNCFSEESSQTLYIPYMGVAFVVIVLAAIFFFANVPDIKTEDDYHLDDAAPGASHSIWSHPHFAMAVAAQFFYVAAQAGIFSFFINYMTSEVPPIPASWSSALTSLSAHAGFLQDWLQGWFEPNKTGVLAISDKGASNLADRKSTRLNSSHLGISYA